MMCECFFFLNVRVWVDMSESYFRFWFSETKSDKCEGFSSSPHHFSSTPNNESEKLKTSLLIAITDYQSVRSLRIHNP